MEEQGPVKVIEYLIEPTVKLPITLRRLSDNLTPPRLNCTDFDGAVQKYKPMVVETLLPTEAKVSGDPR